MMNWLVFFAIQKIPYSVYKLNQGDSIILQNRLNNKNDTTIILTGIISLAKIFCNKELLPLAILKKNNIINQSIDEKTNYQIVAIKTTYIIRLIEQDLHKKNIKEKYKPKIVEHYKETINKYEETIHIVNQKNKKKRILLFILLIFLRFGNIYQYKIQIPFKLTRKCIATMTSTKIETVNKIIRIIHITKKTNLSFIDIKNLKLI